MFRKHYQSLHKEAHDLLQAMAFKAERCNRTLGIQGQHTDRGEDKTPFTSSHHIKKSRIAVYCQYKQRNTFLTNTWQILWDGRPSICLQVSLSNDRAAIHVNQRTDGHDIRGWHKIQRSDDIWSTKSWTWLDILKINRKTRQSHHRL